MRRYSFGVADAPLLERLRERGWRLTPQRRAVAHVLEGEHTHLTAEEVLDRARRVVPEVSLATVYNTLKELVSMAEVLEVRAAPGPLRYDPNVARAHHHLVCRACQILYDVHPRGVRQLALGEDDRRGFRVDEVEVTFSGLCPACATGP